MTAEELDREIQQEALLKVKELGQKGGTEDQDEFRWIVNQVTEDYEELRQMLKLE